MTNYDQILQSQNEMSRKIHESSEKPPEAKKASPSPPHRDPLSPPPQRRSLPPHESEPTHDPEADASHKQNDQKNYPVRPFALTSLLLKPISSRFKRDSLTPSSQYLEKASIAFLTSFKREAGI